MLRGQCNVNQAKPPPKTLGRCQLLHLRHLHFPVFRNSLKWVIAFFFSITLPQLEKELKIITHLICVHVAESSVIFLISFLLLRVLLCSLDWLQTSLPPAPASQLLGSQVCASMLGPNILDFKGGFLLGHLACLTLSIWLFFF